MFKPKLEHQEAKHIHIQPPTPFSINFCLFAYLLWANVTSLLLSLLRHCCYLCYVTVVIFAAFVFMSFVSSAVISYGRLFLDQTVTKRHRLVLFICFLFTYSFCQQAQLDTRILPLSFCLSFSVCVHSLTFSLILSLTYSFCQ